MYNVLEALRQGRKLSAKEKLLHEQGLVTVLRELHGELDAAVAAAYGWPADLPDEEILVRLTALNAERAAEERQGTIRWLRPEYQTRPRAERKMAQARLELPPEPAARLHSVGETAAGTKAEAAPKTAWPADLSEQIPAVRGVLKALQDAGLAVTPDRVAECFLRAPRARVREILQALESLGFT
jgi:hypothetical protein